MAQSLTLDAWTIEQLVDLGRLNPTIPEVAAHFTVPEAEIRTFLAKHPEASEAFERGRALGRLAIRQKLAASTDPSVVAFLARHTLDLDAPARQVDVVVTKARKNEGGESGRP
jgi:hypothetical protein